MCEANKVINGICKDSKRSTAENSLFFLKMQVNYSMAGNLTTKRNRAIAENCGVGKAVREYFPAFVVVQSSQPMKDSTVNTTKIKGSRFFPAPLNYIKSHSIGEWFKEAGGD